MWTYNYVNTDELYHYGHKGMKWGQHIFGRLYKNKDGTLTSLGRKRAKKYADKYRKLTGNKPTTKSIEKHGTATNSKTKSVKDMSDDELRKKIQRLQLEQQLATLQPKQVSKGKKFLDKVLLPSAEEASKTVLKEWMIKEGKKALGLPPGNNSNNKKKNKNK